VIRSNLMTSRNVHVKLDKETHAAYRAQLLQLDVSMQEAFAAFARAVAAGERSAIAIVERCIRDRLKAELASVGLKPSTTKRKPVPFDVLDHNALYDLINEGEQMGASIVPMPSSSSTGGHDEAA
jgi:hypothetical protein